MTKRFIGRTAAIAASVCTMALGSIEVASAQKAVDTFIGQPKENMTKTDSSSVQRATTVKSSKSNSSDRIRHQGSDRPSESISMNFRKGAKSGSGSKAQPAGRDGSPSLVKSDEQKAKKVRPGYRWGPGGAIATGSATGGGNRPNGGAVVISPR